MIYFILMYWQALPDEFIHLIPILPCFYTKVKMRISFFLFFLKKVSQGMLQSYLHMVMVLQPIFMLMLR